MNGVPTHELIFKSFLQVVLVYLVFIVLILYVKINLGNNLIILNGQYLYYFIAYFSIFYV